MNKEGVLRLAVVGHTNTGKTSLLRTLTRDPEFGEVRDEPGTTRHVEGVRLLVDGRPLVEFFDTPGLEDSIALRDYLERLTSAGERLDGPDRIRRFLDTPESRRRFEQEARVLRRLLDCDAGLYVVDVRDPVLGKHKDELSILAACGHPLLPVLNFSRDHETGVETWRHALGRLGLHATVDFDTVAPALGGEAQLYDKLALLLDAHSDLLQRLKSDIARQAQLRHDDAAALIAELLIDVAAFRLSSPPGEEALKETTSSLRDEVRKRENRCVAALLKRYRFNRGDFPEHDAALQGERWGMDLFHPQALKDVGLRVGRGMVAGAMAGATMDVLFAGLSLGSATLIGAAAGGLWQGVERLGGRLLGRIRGHVELSVDDPVLRLLALRQLALVEALERRGHAAHGPILVASENPGLAGLREDALPPELLEARSRPEWSSLAGHHDVGPRRAQAVRSLAARLAALDLRA